MQTAHSGVEGETSKRVGNTPELDVISWVPRAQFEACIDTAARRSAAGVPHALFVIHLERLLDIAARCGQKAERSLLDLVGLTLNNLVGHRFPACRLRQDHIAVIKDGCPSSMAPMVARQICAALEGGTFVWHGRHFRLGANVGITTLHPTPRGPGALVDRALRACAAAQELGNRSYFILEGRAEESRRLAEDRDWFQHLSETIG
ncbi:MAG TPA: GGDEF domain-containing protein [Gammaproteobacteria bacterium]|nr:GGDEF domain-containing protein [Gammaproteobacteria bacterium]